MVSRRTGRVKRIARNAKRGAETVSLDAKNGDRSGGFRRSPGAAERVDAQPHAAESLETLVFPGFRRGYPPDLCSNL
jgi:hypothetical protein